MKLFGEPIHPFENCLFAFSVSDRDAAYSFYSSYKSSVLVSTLYQKDELLIYLINSLSQSEDLIQSMIARRSI